MPVKFWVEAEAGGDVPGLQGPRCQGGRWWCGGDRSDTQGSEKPHDHPALGLGPFTLLYVEGKVVSARSRGLAS